MHKSFILVFLADTYLSHGSIEDLKLTRN